MKYQYGTFDNTNDTENFVSALISSSNICYEEFIDVKGSVVTS